jgi:hypothetical protein
MGVAFADMQASTASTLGGPDRSHTIFKLPKTDTRCNGGGRMPTKSYPHLFKPLALETLKRVQDDELGGLPVGCRFWVHEWFPA